MRHFFLPLLILLCQVIKPAQISAQFTLHDAIVMRPYFKLNDNGKAEFQESAAYSPAQPGEIRSEVAEVFEHYTKGKITQNSVENAFDNGNPFISVRFFAQTSFASPDRLSIAQNGAAPGGFSVTSLVDGLARFLAKRTKDELSLAFFADFKKAISQEPALRELFPNTESLLQMVDTDIYDLQLYVASLRDAFILDLHLLSGNLELYLRHHKTSVFTPAKQIIAIDFFHLAQMIVDGKPPIEMIRETSGPGSEIFDNRDTEGLQDIATGLQLLRLLSESLIDPDSMKWYKGANIRALTSDPLTLKIYFGFLWHKANESTFKFSTGDPLSLVVGKAASDISIAANWRQTLRDFGNNADNIERTSAGHEDASENPRVHQDFTQYADSYLKIVGSINNFSAVILKTDAPIIDPKYLQLIQNLNSLQFNLRREHYSAAVGNTLYALNALLGDEFQGKEQFLKYGSFIAAIAEAESPQEVQNAIELFALPAGSAKAKKAKGRFTIALNAYTGFGGGAEYLRDEARPEAVASIITAPVGVSFNRGLGKKSGSIGLFVPLLDVGAVTAYRFNDRNAEDLPELKWGNIVAPGLYLTYDTPGKWPVAFGFGAQRGPGLRKVRDDGSLNISSVPAWRLGGFLTIDIPINYLHMSGK